MTTALRDRLSANIWASLICPQCGIAVKQNGSGGVCDACATSYPLTKDGALDLRLKKSKMQRLDITVGSNLLPKEGFDFKPLKEKQSPGVDFSGLEIPHHLTKEMLSYFPKSNANGSLMLDLGCGSEKHRGVCERAGFEYVGVDYDSATAGILGDAHSLPFKDNSFEFILSVAVLEHIQFPLVMMKEVYRVLKPGGIFIGTVSFLEPFHGDSFYHCTHLGLFNSLKEGGFKIEKIAPNPEWSGLVAQASMGLFPKMPKIFTKGLVWPLHTLHRIWWRIGRIFNPNASDDVRIRNTTGAFIFIASKEAQ